MTLQLSVSIFFPIIDRVASKTIGYTIISWREFVCMPCFYCWSVNSCSKSNWITLRFSFNYVIHLFIHTSFNEGLLFPPYLHVLTVLLSSRVNMCTQRAVKDTKYGWHSSSPMIWLSKQHNCTNCFILELPSWRSLVETDSTSIW